jgi:hypothetical protein
METFLTGILSQLLLPVFVLMILCTIAGAKPDFVLRAFFDLIAAVVSGVFKLLETLVGAIFAPKRGTTGRRTTPRSRSRTE